MRPNSSARRGHCIVRGRTSEPSAEWFCHLAEPLAVLLLLCLSWESRQPASFYELQFCWRLLST